MKAKIMPTLETKRLILRKVTLHDSADLFTYAQQPVVSKYVFWTPHQTLNESKNFIKSLIKEYKDHGKFMWGVQLKAQNKLIGTCGFVASYPINKSLEIGYVFSPQYWGQGYAKEALQAVINYGFSSLDVVRIEGICVVDNLGSAQTMASCHMVFEGILHDAFVKDNQTADCKLFAITKRNWQQLKNVT